MEYIFIEAGEIITCPQCNTDLLQCTQTLKSGQSLGASNFKPLLEDLILTSGNDMVCPKCNAGFGKIVQSLQLHVKNRGWI